MGLFASLVCALRGHDWDKAANPVPEDRQLYTCGRCGETALYPPDYGDPLVPPEQRD
jgi:hypothetical protein